MLADGLMIKKVTKNDAGEYTCKAFQVSTTGSSFEEKTIRLNIKREFLPLNFQPPLIAIPLTIFCSSNRQALLHPPGHVRLAERHVRLRGRDGQFDVRGHGGTAGQLYLVGQQ